MSVVVDAGPLIALFDPKDAQHGRCVDVLRGIREPLVTTIPVLTEAFHLLGPASTGSTAYVTSSSKRGSRCGTSTTVRSGVRSS